VRIETSFGTIAVRHADVGVLVDAVRGAADAASSRSVYVHPAFAALYLMTGTDNPTPFQILLTGYNAPAAFDAAIAALEHARPPLVVALEKLVPAGDPLMAYVREHYVRDPDALPPRLASVGFYRRRAP
jgi:hypothetical protein